MNKIIKYIKNPKLILLYLINKGFFNWLSDKKYLKMKYKLETGESLNLNEPQTFNQKLQWLKLYDRNPRYTKMVDKYQVKKLVADIIGEEYIIPTLGIWNDFKSIDFNSLPHKFALKPTHTSGNIYLCKDKSTINYIKLSKEFKRWLKQNYYYIHREWPYKNVEPKIIAEKYMGENLFDYKFFCFNGKVKTILVCSNRNRDSKNTDFYNKDWMLMPFTRQNHTNNSKGIPKPKNLEKMICISEKLSAGISFVRVDLYEIEGRVFFGELTFYPSSGFEGFKPKKYDKVLGDWLKLPKENCKNSCKINLKEKK